MFISGYGHIAKIRFNGRHPNIARSHCPTASRTCISVQRTCKNVDGLCDGRTADTGTGQKYVIDTRMTAAHLQFDRICSIIACMHREKFLVQVCVRHENPQPISRSCAINFTAGRVTRRDKRPDTPLTASPHIHICVHTLNRTCVSIYCADYRYNLRFYQYTGA